jgi:hypothetical protein
MTEKTIGEIASILWNAHGTFSGYCPVMKAWKATPTPNSSSAFYVFLDNLENTPKDTRAVYMNYLTERLTR